MWEAFDTKIMFYSHANNNRYEYKKTDFNFHH